MQKSKIIARLPYTGSFLFVDEILEIDDNGVKGTFFLDEKLDFYSGHFTGNPVTPGVILTEIMSQIGLVCLGIFLLGDTFITGTGVALSSVQMEFLKPVFPNEKVIVISKKIYFRFGKLKCQVQLLNEQNEEVCSGVISGMITIPK